MNRLVRGLIAGAAGTMALDVASYADMVMRGRAASNLPSDMIRRIAEKLDIAPLNAPPEQTDEATKNRRTALGALSGYAVGLTIGAIYGAVAPALRWVPLPLKGVLAGAMAMAASDVPATLLEVTDPGQWGPGGWLSDIAPHAAYGLVTAAVMDALLPEAPRNDGTIRPQDLFNSGARFTVVDIRKRRDDMQIPGSRVMEGVALEDGSDVPFDKNDEVVLYCGSGNSCVRIAGTLRARGYRTLALRGGYKAWLDAGLPTEARISG